MYIRYWDKVVQYLRINFNNLLLKMMDCLFISITIFSKDIPTIYFFQIKMTNFIFHNSTIYT